jgi:hypothetical protein
MASATITRSDPSKRDKSKARSLSEAKMRLEHHPVDPCKLKMTWVSEQVGVRSLDHASAAGCGGATPSVAPRSLVRFRSWSQFRSSFPVLMRSLIGLARLASIHPCTCSLFRLFHRCVCPFVTRVCRGAIVCSTVAGGGDPRVHVQRSRQQGSLHGPDVCAGDGH